MKLNISDIKHALADKDHTMLTAFWRGVAESLIKALEHYGHHRPECAYFEPVKLEDGAWDVVAGARACTCEWDAVVMKRCERK